MNFIERVKSLKWGVLKSEYRKTFSDKSWYPDHPTQNAVGFSENYLGYPLQIYAYFIIDIDKDKLAKVVTIFSNLTDKQLKELFGKLVADLTEKYGEPQFSELITNFADTPPEFRGSEMKIWKTSNSIVSATLALSESGSTSPGIGIDWSDIENDLGARRWAKSGLSDGEKPEKLPKDFKFSEAQIEEIKRSIEKE